MDFLLLISSILLVSGETYYPWGHRGSSAVAPENTLPAFQLAVEQGAHFELDLQITKDNYVVVLHDDTVGRTTNGTGRINSLSWIDYVQYLDAGSWKGQQYAGTKVPLLSDVLQYLQANHLTNRLVMLDTKNIVPSIIPYIAEVLKSYPDWSRNMVMGCWEIECLKETNIYLPGVKTVWIASFPPPTSQFPEFHKLNLWGFHIGTSPAGTNPTFVQAAKADGFTMHCWTIDSSENIKKYLDMGVQGPCGNYPDRIVAQTGPVDSF